MRLAIRLLVSSITVALVACGAEPVPVAQRFPTAADAPGTKPDPVEKGEMVEDLDGFIPAFSPALIDPDRDEMTTVFQGLKRAGLDVRFFGETHDPEGQHLFSWFIELDSEDEATGALDYLEADAKKPCPHSCATRVSSFDVADIPGARGVHRVATAEDIEAAGTADEHPSESFLVGFTVGAIVYTLDLHGEPGTVTEDHLQKIANAFYERLTSG